MAERTTSNMILWFFLGCLLVSTFMLGWLIWPFISVIVLGGVMRGVFAPLYRIMQASGKIRPSIASLIVCCLIFFILSERPFYKRQYHVFIVVVAVAVKLKRG